MTNKETIWNHLSQKVRVTDNGCWEYTGYCWKKSGYGRIRIGGRILRVHRVSAFLFLGFDLNSPMMVLHTCDNPPCFNPDHLFIGTGVDNQQDCKAKGRLGARGKRKG